MNRRSALLSILTMIMLCLLSLPNELHAAGQDAGERIVLARSALKSWPQPLTKLPPATTALVDPYFVLDLYAWGCGKMKKFGGSLRPEVFINTKGGQIAFTDDPRNFRLTLFVQGSGHPGICFRHWDGKLTYRFDVMGGTLTKHKQGKEEILARASSPVFTEAERTARGPKPWKLLEITAREGQFRIRRSGDGEKWQTIIECVDPEPIEGGVIALNVIRQIAHTLVSFGDMEIISLGDSKVPSAPVPGADELHRILLPLAEHIRHGGNAHARNLALRYLDSLTFVDHPAVPLALAMVLCEQMPRIQSARDTVRLNALRMVRKLKLEIDITRELLKGVTHEDPAFRIGAIRSLARLKLKPEQLYSRTVDGLLDDRLFHRRIVGGLLHSGGEPLRKLVIGEVERRYTAATDRDQRRRLMRALFRDALCLPVLLKGLADPAPEVRQMALHILRFLESPLSWQVDPNI